MHRAPLLQLVESYKIKYLAETETVSKYKDFVIANENCFERSLLEGHITCGAWILDGSGTKTLLTHHRKLNRWLQLGGHADGDHDVHRVAAKEAQEESGISTLELVSKDIFDIDIHKIPTRGDVPAHLHYDARFLFRTTDNEKYEVSNESIDLAWVKIDEIEKYSSEESILRMVEKTREFI